MSKRVPKQRMHNPEGGGFKANQRVHKSIKDKKSDKVYDKIARNVKLSFKDLKDLVDLEEE